MGFNDDGSWVLTMVEIDVGFDKINVGVTIVEISMMEIGGWRDQWIGFCYEFWVLILAGWQD